MQNEVHCWFTVLCAFESLIFALQKTDAPIFFLYYPLDMCLLYIHLCLFMTYIHVTIKQTFNAIRSSPLLFVNLTFEPLALCEPGSFSILPGALAKNFWRVREP